MAIETYLHGMKGGFNGLFKGAILGALVVGGTMLGICAVATLGMFLLSGGGAAAATWALCANFPVIAAIAGGIWGAITGPAIGAVEEIERVHHQQDLKALQARQVVQEKTQRLNVPPPTPTRDTDSRPAGNFQQRLDASREAAKTADQRQI